MARSCIHSAAALLCFRYEKMRAHEGERQVAEHPAEHTPTPALTQKLLLLIYASVGTAGKPGDVVYTQAAAHFVQCDL